MAATKPRDLTPAGTWVGTTLSNLWLWFKLVHVAIVTARLAIVLGLATVSIRGH